MLKNLHISKEMLTFADVKRTFKKNKNMDKNFLKAIGTSFDLDQTTKAYELGGVNVYWTDYTYDWYNNLSQEEQMKDENLDNAWDMDKYYKDFDNWWISLSTEKQNEIYNQI